MIANSLSHYDDGLSRELTELVATANLRIRELGFKPYVAPAISSGAMQLLLTLRRSVALQLGGSGRDLVRRPQPFNRRRAGNRDCLLCPTPLFERLRETQNAAGDHLAGGCRCVHIRPLHAALPRAPGGCSAGMRAGRRKEMIGISEELTVIRPGGRLPRCAGALEAALAGRQAEVLSRLEGPLTGRRLLFAVSLDEGGVNRGVL